MDNKLNIVNRASDIVSNDEKSMLQVFVIYDKVAQLYGLPVFYENMQVAMRAFKSLINKEGNIYYEHSADFDLVHIGVYNKDTCTFNGMALSHICNGFTLKN